MRMIGSSNNYPINGFTHFLIHLTVIPVFLCFRKFIEYPFCIFPVHITKSHNVFRTLYFIDIGMPHATNTYGCNI